MAITINSYYKGKNGNARKFAEEMISSGSDELPTRDKAYIKD